MSFNLSDASQWFDFIGKFDDAWSRFLSSYNTLINIQQVPPEFQDEYNSVLAQANDYYGSMVDLNNLKTQAQNFFSDYGQTIMDNPNVLGLMGLHRSKGLGIAPLVLGIGAAAAVALVYEVLNYTQVMDTIARKVEYANSHSAAEANRLFGNPGEGFLGGLIGYEGISNALIPLGLIAALIFLGPPVLKMIEGRK